VSFMRAAASFICPRACNSAAHRAIFARIAGRAHAYAPAGCLTTASCNCRKLASGDGEQKVGLLAARCYATPGCTRSAGGINQNLVQEFVERGIRLFKRINHRPASEIFAFIGRGESDRQFQAHRFRRTNRITA
jgi:hypothetical protein